ADFLPVLKMHGAAKKQPPHGGRLLTIEDEKVEDLTQRRATKTIIVPTLQVGGLCREFSSLRTGTVHSGVPVRLGISRWGHGVLAGVAVSCFLSPPGRKNVKLSTCSRRRSSSRCRARAFNKSVNEMSPSNLPDEGSTTGIRVIPFSAMRYTTARNASSGNAFTVCCRTRSPSA